MDDNTTQMILVVADSQGMNLPQNVRLEEFYEVTMKFGDHAIKTCTDITKLSEFMVFPTPHLIVWHLNRYLYKQTLKTLAEINQMYTENKRPLVLLVVPTDFSASEFDTLIDETVDSKFDPVWLWGIIKNLLEKKTP